MGIFNILKNLFKTEKSIEKETIIFNQIEKWISKNNKNLKVIKDQFVFSIKEIINSFSVDLSGKIKVLEQVDLDKYKVEERGRLIVKENYKNYLEHVKKLENEIVELEIIDPISTIDNINDIFENFEKKSNLNFQKASILIGKELGSILESLGKFSRYVKELVDNNKNYLKKSEILFSIEKNLKEIEEYRSQKDNINNNLKIFDKKINIIKQHIENINVDINNVRNLEGYIKNLENIEKLDQLKLNYEKAIYNFKNIINFKDLFNFFHINKDDMNILKEFKSNFKDHYYKDPDKFIALLNESKLMNLEIQNNIIKIKDLKVEMENIQIEKDETDELVMKIKKENLGIENYNIGVSKDEKRLIKIERSIFEIKKQIVDKLREINVEVSFM